MKTKDNIHAGHRKRLRENIEVTGMYNLSDIHFLEYLLTFVIPRADTNPIAHALLKEFTHIDHIFDTSIENLMRVEGVGLKTARFLQAVGLSAYMYNKSRGTKRASLANMEDLLIFLKEIIPPSHNEQFIVLNLTKDYKLKNYKILNGIDHSFLDVNIRDLSEYLIKNKVEFCVLVHTHPDSKARPSESDIEMFKRFTNLFTTLDIRLRDNIIIGKEDYYSTRVGYIEDIKEVSNVSYLKNY